MLGMGAAATGAIASQRLLAAGPATLDGPATIIGPAQAVRLNPPKPQGGFNPTARYVALYGHPGSTTLGALGEQGLAQSIDRTMAVAAQYAPFGRPVVPTFEILATVASSAAGADGDYSNEFPASKFTPWIEAAAMRGMHVILDLQPGRSTFPSQAREIESLLVYPHVSLALDPEWRVGPTQTPVNRIGTVDAAEVNQTIAYVDGLVRQYHLPPKMLVVHQFTPSMITNKTSIRGTANVQVVLHMDGWGSLPVKQASWGRMVADLPPGALTGWKNFYDEDRPTPTPAQSVAVAPAPILVSYQ